MAKGVRFRIYPVMIGIVGLGLAIFLLSRLEIQVQIGTPPPLNREPVAVPKASLTPDPSPVVTPEAIASAKPAILPGTHRGSLRIGNPTEHPVRIALLPQAIEESNGANKSQPYGQPVHWDFAPAEGGATGLLVSLPNGNRQLRSGDILIAFAQDGSRRYWGPYVLGKTVSPTWDEASSEWQLVLQAQGQ